MLSRYFSAEDEDIDGEDAHILFSDEEELRSVFPKFKERNKFKKLVRTEVNSPKILSRAFVRTFVDRATGVKWAVAWTLE